MATRSTISIENLDGTINTVYSHWDGYIQYNGVILQKYYNSRELVEKLIAGGGISSLGRRISDVPMSFDRKEDDYTVYYSYRGEPVEKSTFHDFDTYEKENDYQEYEYLFTKDNVWSVFDSREWHDLEYVIQEKDYTDPYSTAEAA